MAKRHKHEWVVMGRSRAGTESVPYVLLMCRLCDATATAHATHEEWSRAAPGVGPGYEWTGEEPVIGVFRQRLMGECGHCQGKLYIVQEMVGWNKEQEWARSDPDRKYVVYANEVICPHCGTRIKLPPWEQLLTEAEIARAKKFGAM